MAQPQCEGDRVPLGLCPQKNHQALLRMQESPPWRCPHSSIRVSLQTRPAWPGPRGTRAHQANTAFLSAAGRTAHRVRDTPPVREPHHSVTAPAGRWARTAHFPAPWEQLSGQPQTVTSKQASNVIPVTPPSRLNMAHLHASRSRHLHG